MSEAVLYTRKEVAAMLKISFSHVRSLEAAGILRPLDVRTPGTKKPALRYTRTLIDEGLARLREANQMRIAEKAGE